MIEAHCIVTAFSSYQQFLLTGNRCHGEQKRREEVGGLGWRLEER
jgi:hypothetical protein